MRNLILFTITTFGLLVSSCTPEEVTITVPDHDGFSNPLDLAFSTQEMEVLNRELDIDRQINLLFKPLPGHIATFSGESAITNTESDARKAVLGRVLFYDKALSATGETSCASCHLQDKAFADPKAFSDGINGAITKRNSIALGSVPTFAPSVSGYGASPDEESAGVEGSVKFFWDERAATIKEQSELTIQDELEMGKDLHELSDELRSREMYQILSMKAFGTIDLTPDRITLALEKFTSTMAAMDTRFDDYVDVQFGFSDNLDQFTEAELLGGQLFEANCASCHGVALIEPNVATANNGLDADYTDKGIGVISGRAADNGVFKVPFLRNVALTAPYMHDGRFATLEDVVNHYSEGIQDHRNLHPNLKNDDFSARNMHFTAEEKQALVAFLEMTTDETMATARELSDPFRR